MADLNLPLSGNHLTIRVQKLRAKNTNKIRMGVKGRSRWREERVYKEEKDQNGWKD